MSLCHAQLPTNLQEGRAFGQNPHANLSSKGARQCQAKLLGPHVAPASQQRSHPASFLLTQNCSVLFQALCPVGLSV